MSPYNTDEAQGNAPAPNDANEVVFIPDAPSGLPVYFGGNVRAEVQHITSDGSTEEDDVNAGGDDSQEAPMDVSIAAADPDRILSSAVSAPEDAIVALRQSPSFSVYTERLAAARVAVRDGIRKATFLCFHISTAHSICFFSGEHKAYYLSKK